MLDIDYLNKNLNSENIFCEKGDNGFFVFIIHENERLEVLFINLDQNLLAVNKDAFELKGKFPYLRYGVLFEGRITGKIISNCTNIDFFENINLCNKFKLIDLIRCEIDNFLYGIH
jgi:hypothetical protein